MDASATFGHGHTPGPWRANAGKDCYEIRCSPASVRGTNDHLANVLLIGSMTAPEVVQMAGANARLIAAAPDLLAACQDLLQHASLTEHMSASSVERARAAVAKAGAQ